MRAVGRAGMGEPAYRSPQPDSEVHVDNVEFVKTVYEAFGRGDIPAVLAAMDPGIEWRAAEGHPYMPSGEPWIGPDAVLGQLFMRIGADWDGFAADP